MIFASQQHKTAGCLLSCLRGQETPSVLEHPRAQREIRIPCPGGFPETFLGQCVVTFCLTHSAVTGSAVCIWIRQEMQTRDNYTKKACSLGICSLHLALPVTRAPGTSDFISLSVGLLNCEGILASGVMNVNDGAWYSRGHSQDGPGALMAIPGAVSHSLSPNPRQQFRKFN